MAAALASGVNLRRVDPGRIAISLDETTTPEIVETVWAAFGGNVDPERLDVTGDAIPQPLRRTSAFLSHKVFNTHRSDTEMLRYMRTLSDRDLALDRAMIPPGSCTMKHNAQIGRAAWREKG